MNWESVVRHCEAHGQLATKVADSCAWAVLADALHVQAHQPPRYAKDCRLVEARLSVVEEER